MTKERDIKLSNIKGWLILLVVFGHSLSAFHLNTEDIYFFIYSFHMPLFVLLSGYFAKRVTASKIINFLLLLAVFQPLYRAFSVLIKDEKKFSLKPDLPYYHLWYLFASVIWYLVAMGINRLNLRKGQKIILLILFFALGIGARFIADPFEAFIHSLDYQFKGTSFSYMRIMTFMPYFLIGFFLTKEGMAKWYSCLKNHRIINIMLLVGIFVCVKLLNPVNADVVFKGKNGIAIMEGSMYNKIFYIVIGYIISLLMFVILFNLVSDSKTVITGIGNRTLPIYLFHVFIVKLLRNITILHEISNLILLPLLFVLSYFIAFLLGSDFFAKCTYYICNPLALIRHIKGFIYKQDKKIKIKV